MVLESRPTSSLRWPEMHIPPYTYIGSTRLAKSLLRKREGDGCMHEGVWGQERTQIRYCLRWIYTTIKLLFFLLVVVLVVSLLKSF